MKEGLLAAVKAETARQGRRGEAALKGPLEEIKAELLATVEHRLHQWTPAHSHNQIEEKLEQLRGWVAEEAQEQRRQVALQMQGCVLGLKQELIAREENTAARIKEQLRLECFETEKVEFLQTIQEQMAALDAMLK